MRRLIAVLLLCGAATCAAQTEYLRPTADATTTDVTAGDCGTTGTNYASSSMSGVYASKSGAGPSGTANTMSGSGGTSNPLITYQARIFTAWQSTSQTYTALTINLSTGCAITTNGYGGYCGASYSTNGGSTWTSFYQYHQMGGGTDPQATHTATITGTALGSVQVRVCAKGVGGLGDTADTATASVYDIWSTGTYSASGGKDGGTFDDGAIRWPRGGLPWAERRVYFKRTYRYVDPASMEKFTVSGRKPRRITTVAK